MATQSARPRSYVNIGPFPESSPSHLSDKPPHPYINVAIQNEQQEERELAQEKKSNRTINTNGHSSEVEEGTKSPVDSKSSSSSSRSHSPLKRQFSDLSHKLHSMGERASVSPLPTSPVNVDMASTKLSLVMQEGRKTNGGCENCSELNRQLAMWEIGVSGLTRNYSRILAYLIQVRNAAMALEFRLETEPSASTGTATSEEKAIDSSPSIPPSSKIPKNRQSMFVSDRSALAAASIKEQRDIAKNMYPNREEPAPTAEKLTKASSQSSKDLKELNLHLEGAIELCQQLAAACFRSNNLSTLPNKRSPTYSPSTSPTTAGGTNLPRRVTGTSTAASGYKPSLQSISEMKLAETMRKRRMLTRSPSAPNLEYSCELTSSSDSHQSENDSDNGFVTIYKENIPDHVTKAKDAVNKGFNHVTEDVENGSPPQNQNSKTKKVNDDGAPMSTGENLHRAGSILSSVSTYSDNDVKVVMSKIATLEEERYRLLETIDNLQEDNTTVRQSLHEILGDLENKDLQLTLAMQDLTIATGEIKRAAEMRRKLDALSSDREALLNRLSDLEDESAAVKVSLIQLLQEKSATNKTLALENYRLAQRVRQVSRSKSSTGESPLPGDNVSIHSAYSTTTEDATLHEAYMGSDMSSNFVHKQGFLVKQGGKVKSWKKRLFVLNTDGLSYYKTEQPIQTLPIEKIERVQLCHGRCQQPHMFEVHTQGRVFYLSAPTEDEMQSWVGMLETLKQFKRAATLHRDRIIATSKAQAEAHGSGDDNIASPTSPRSVFGDTSLIPNGGGFLVDLDNEEESDDEEQQHQVLQQRESLQLDDDDDTSYLQDLKEGTFMSAPSRTFSQAEVQSDLIASLDLSNM